MGTFLCVANGTMAAGETYVLMRFARDLQNAGHRVTFIGPTYSAQFLEQAGFPCASFVVSRRENRRRLSELMDSAPPDVVLLADYYFFQISAYLREHVDLEPVFASGLPIGVFDNADYYRSTPKGTFKSNVTQFTSARRFPRLPTQTKFLLKPCPLHDPTVVEANVHRFPLLRDHDNEGEVAKAQAKVRAAVKCPPEAVMIFWPVAAYHYEMRWAPKLDRTSFDEKGVGEHQEKALESPKRKPEKNWYYYINRMIVEYLADLDVPVHVVNMSPYAHEYAAPAKGRVTCFNVSSVPFSEFDEYMLAADVFLVDNRFATTLGRASTFPARVGCVVSSLEIRRLYDRVEPSFPLTPRAHDIVRRLESNHPRSVRPTWVSHMGWVDYLQSLVEDNPFCDTYRLLDVFDDRNCSRALGDLVVNRSAIESLIAAKAEYRSLVERLPSVSDIAEKVLHSYSVEKREQ